MSAPKKSRRPKTRHVDGTCPRCGHVDLTAVLSQATPDQEILDASVRETSVAELLPAVSPDLGAIASSIPAAIALTGPESIHETLLTKHERDLEDAFFASASVIDRVASQAGIADDPTRATFRALVGDYLRTVDPHAPTSKKTRRRKR